VYKLHLNFQKTRTGLRAVPHDVQGVEKEAVLLRCFSKEGKLRPGSVNQSKMTFRECKECGIKRIFIFSFPLFVVK